MTHARLLLATLVISALLVAPAAADWNVGDPCKMHYPQLPVYDPVNHPGVDVLASQTPYGAWKIVADDWCCTATGPVSDIHIWGTWFQIPSPQPDPAAQFKLSIHSNVDGTPSHPGPQLWSAIITPGQYTYRQWEPDRTGHFWDPNLGAAGIMGDDKNIWQYNFENLPTPFEQQLGTIYWLDVQVLSPNGGLFGWTSTDPMVTPHFMDDAVFGDTDGFAGPVLAPGWTPLVYPGGPPGYIGQSVDLAFVITPEPGTMLLLAAGAGLAGLRRRRR